MSWRQPVMSDTRTPDYNRYANPEFFGGSDNSLTLAGLLLLREFARRPKTRTAQKP